MDVLGKLDKERSEHLDRNDSSKYAQIIKDKLKGKEKNWNRNCGEYLGFDDRVDLMRWVNRLQACHSNAVVDFNKQLGSFVGAYQINSFEEDIRIGKKTREVKPDLVTIEVPWYMVTTLLPKIFSKYFKNPWHKIEHSDGDPFEGVFEPVKKYISPSNNPEYQWTEKWEFGIEPFNYKNLRSFQKARVKEKRKYIKKLVEARQEEKLRLEREEEERIKLEKQREKKERRANKYSNAYENLDEKDGECYVICEKNKVFTSIKNKSNCLYVGETENFAARRKNYKDFNKPNNEIVNKLAKKFSKLSREKIVSKLKNNIKVKRLKFKSLQHSGYRKHIEGYLIWRLNPLLNTSKTKSHYYKNRSFVVWEEENEVRTAHGSPSTSEKLF
tara:strand:+ start:386 stop:1540 length:1155 start_codon:yes stop_codon:yes gene_type:complete